MKQGLAAMNLICFDILSMMLKMLAIASVWSSMNIVSSYIWFLYVIRSLWFGLMSLYVLSQSPAMKYT